MAKPVTAALAPDLTPSTRPSVALKAVARLAEAWSLRRADLPTLLGAPGRTVRRWYESPPLALDRNVLERISHLLNIYNGAHAVFGDYADRWMQKPNRAFGERPPIALLKTGTFSDLLELRRYIDYAGSA